METHKKFEKVFIPSLAEYEYHFYYNDQKANGSKDIDPNSLFKIIKDYFKVPVIYSNSMDKNYLAFKFFVNNPEEAIDKFRLILDEFFCVANWWKVEVLNPAGSKDFTVVCYRKNVSLN